MRHAKELTGCVFGKLTCVERVGSYHGSASWRCTCECGGEKVVSAAALKAGGTRSCGCIPRGRKPKETAVESQEAA